MNITPFPTLSPATIDAINVIGQWLAQDDFSGEVPYQADCVILAGNAVMPTIDAACKIARDQQIPLLISGGIGHSTTFLYSAIAQHPHYNTIRTTGRAEATILADIAHQFWHIPHEKIWIEDQSTNCGENARFSIALLNQAVERVHTAIVVQDPTMQRRTISNRSISKKPTSSTAKIPAMLSMPISSRLSKKSSTVASARLSTTDLTYSKSRSGTSNACLSSFVISRSSQAKSVIRLCSRRPRRF